MLPLSSKFILVVFSWMNFFNNVLIHFLYQSENHLLYLQREWFWVSGSKVQVYAYFKFIVLRALSFNVFHY